MINMNNNEERREEEGATTRLLVPSEHQPTQLHQQHQQRTFMSKLFFGRGDGQERLHGSIPATGTLLGGKNKKNNGDKSKAHNSGYSTVSSDTAEDGDEQEEDGPFTSRQSLFNLMSERFFGSAESLRFPKPTHFKNVDDVLGVVFSFVEEMDLIRTCQLVNKQWQYAVATIPSVRLTTKQRVDSYNDHLLADTKKSNRLALFQICYAVFVLCGFACCLGFAFIHGSTTAVLTGFILALVFGSVGALSALPVAMVVALVPTSYTGRRAGITLMAVCRVLFCFAVFVPATFAVSMYYGGDIVSGGGTMIADCPRDASILGYPEYIRFVRDPVKSWKTGKMISVTDRIFVKKRGRYETHFVTDYWVLSYTATTYPDECGPKYAGKKIKPLPTGEKYPPDDFPTVALNFFPDFSRIKPNTTIRTVQGGYWFGTDPTGYAFDWWKSNWLWRLARVPLVSDATFSVDMDVLETRRDTALIGFFLVVPLFFVLSALLCDFWPYISARRRMIQVPKLYAE